MNTLNRIERAHDATQCFGRAFPKHFTVFNRKTSEFNKAKTGCDFGDGHGLTTGGHQRSPYFG